MSYYLLAIVRQKLLCGECSISKLKAIACTVETKSEWIVMIANQSCNLPYNKIVIIYYYNYITILYVGFESGLRRGAFDGFSLELAIVVIQRRVY